MPDVKITRYRARRYRYLQEVCCVPARFDRPPAPYWGIMRRIVQVYPKGPNDPYPHPYRLKWLRQIRSDYQY